MRNEQTNQLYESKLIKLIEKGIITEDRIVDVELKKRVKNKLK